MVSAKRSRLVLRTKPSGPRKGELKAFAGTCRIGEGPFQDVQVTDIAPEGCRLIGSAVGVTKGEFVEIRVGALQPIVARFKWARPGSFGVAFENPLDGRVLEQIGENQSISTVIPMHRQL